MNELFVEKYRPKKWEEVIGQKEIVGELKNLIINKNLPHILFHGQAGLGKTTIAYIIGRELFGENFRSNFMELNASDERGIQTIREKVKEFAKVKPLNANFKIIFLDEADHLTNDAQASLRRIMELYSNTTRFILTCNYLYKIIIPIQSRCKLYKFNQFESKDVEKFILGIINKENINVKGEEVEELEGIGCKDLRRCLNILQGMSSGVGLINIKKEEGDVSEIFKDMNFIKIRCCIDELLKKGRDDRRLLVEIRDYMMDYEPVNINFRNNTLKNLLQADVWLVSGVESVLVWDWLVIGMVEGNEICSRVIK